MKNDDKVVNFPKMKEEEYKSAKDLYKEVAKQEFTKFVCLVLNDKGEGMLYKYGMSNADANYELDQIKHILLSQGR